SALEIQDMQEDMSRSHFVSSERERLELESAWKASGVNCVFQNTVLASDLIGMGEMGVRDFRGDAYIGNTSFNTWFASLLIGRGTVGIRAGDVVKSTHLLH